MGRIRSSLTYANVMATIAVFLALGGGAYAAITLPKNSVGNKQIKNNAVTAGKINKNAITSAKVKDGSLLSQDFKAGQLPAGARGPQGDKGDTGAQGSPGTARAYALVASDGTLVTARSKNVDRAVRVSAGNYCVNFTITATTPDNLSATLSSIGEIATQATGSCIISGQSYNAIVNTADSAGTLADRTFFVMAP